MKSDEITMAHWRQITSQGQLRDEFSSHLNMLDLPENLQSRAGGRFAMYARKKYKVAAYVNRMDRVRHNPPLPTPPISLISLIKQEFRKLVCTSDPAYKSLRAKLRGLLKKSNNVVVGSIVTIIAAKIGVSSAVIVGIIGALLSVFLTVGRNAFCAWISQ